MSEIDIGDYPKNVKKAVRYFWSKKAEAKKKKKQEGKVDQGQRGGATAGKNLDGFVELLKVLIENAACEEVSVCTSTKEITLPGYFRSTKRWDVVVLNKSGTVIAAIELKSLGGPSYGNNINSRCEEAIGTAVDFRTAQREGRFGRGAQPFLGYLILVEDDEKSRSPAKNPVKSPHFENDPIFEGASYQKRMSILCERLVQENLYNAAVAIAAKDDGGKSGGFSDISETTTVEEFLRSVVCHVMAKTSGTREHS